MLGETIKHHRKKLEMTQAELGSYLTQYPKQYHPLFIHRLETNKRQPRLKHLFKLCEIFKISLSDLLAGDIGLSQEEKKDISYQKEKISRQRIWQKKNPKKVRASQLARSNGHLVEILYECRCDYDGTKHMHHFDHNRPFEFILLCPTCHAAEDKRLRSLEIEIH